MTLTKNIKQQGHVDPEVAHLSNLDCVVKLKKVGICIKTTGY